MGILEFGVINELLGIVFFLRRIRMSGGELMGYKDID